MKSMIIETSYGWRNRYTLIEDKGEYILKIRQYKLKKDDADGHCHNELHVFGNNSVIKLLAFLKENTKQKKNKR